ncbi:hypothetical protein OIU79_001169 [Salix purpurea]|uniref:FAR1 domain-containing protein n=1 Tax=Salix purpurea TaxID=77065 RepID=A0A9Q0V4X4_SALPP|nr:hypothetical protein OIU79_001169 [Salix purpurea]
MMASTSGEQFNSNRNYRCWLAETFDDQETADDELADNLDGNDNIIEQSIQDFPVGLQPFEPYIGMEFESAEYAREFYELYGRRMGFTIRNNRTRQSQGGGCNAMLRIAAKDGGKWVIYGFIKEHNHDLNPSKIPPRRSHRIAFSEDEKDLKIRELSTELHREKKKSAAYQKQLQMVLTYIEEHTQRLSLKAEVVADKVKELEAEEPEDPDLKKACLQLQGSMGFVKKGWF